MKWRPWPEVIRALGVVCDPEGRVTVYHCAPEARDLAYTEDYLCVSEYAPCTEYGKVVHVLEVPWKNLGPYPYMPTLGLRIPPWEYDLCLPPGLQEGQDYRILDIYTVEEEEV